MECFQMLMYYLQPNLLMEYQQFHGRKMYQIKNRKINKTNSNID